MSNSGIVTAETDYLREAIMAAEPTDPIAQVCNGTLEGHAFDPDKGGFDGSDLLNISIAILRHRRLYTEKPPTAQSVELDDGPPQSFIGKTIIELLGNNESEDTDGLSFHFSRPNRADHFCTEAEGFYLQSLTQKAPETMVLNGLGKSIFYLKGVGHPTLLTQRTTFINGVKIPPGIICSVDYDKDFLVPTDMPGTSILPVSGICQISPLRPSIFAVPHDERRETFLTPQWVDDKDWDWFDRLLDGCGSMLGVSRDIAYRLSKLQFDRSQI